MFSISVLKILSATKSSAHLFSRSVLKKLIQPQQGGKGKDEIQLPSGSEHFSFQLLSIKYYLPNGREMFSPYQLTRPLCLHDFTSPLDHKTSFFTWPGHNLPWAIGPGVFFPALLGSGVRSSSAAYVTHFSFSSLVRSSCACSNSCLSWICASCWSAISERMVCNFTNSCKTEIWD